MKHFSWLAPSISTDNSTSSQLIREQLGWRPTGPGLLDGGQFDDRPAYIVKLAHQNTSRADRYNIIHCITSKTGISATSIWRSNVLFLADFLAGCLNPTASSIVQGNPKRQVFVNTFALYGQDGWQITKKINFNYGLRYDYEGPVHSAYPTYRSLTRRARQAFQWQGRG